MSINQKYIESNSTSTSKLKLFSIDWGSENTYKVINIIIPILFIKYSPYNLTCYNLLLLL